MKKLVLLLVLFFSIQFSYSSSILGGEFSWNYIGQDSFMITFKLYNDCNGDKPGNINIDVFCKDAQKLQTLNIQTPPPVDITPTCDNTKTRCEDPNSDFPFGIEAYTYQKLLVLDHSLTCCEILLTFQECCRSTNIDNGGAVTIFYTDAMFNRCVLHGDNSPSCTNPPIAIIIKDFDFMFCNGITDFDIGNQGGLLDSLSYSFVYPETDKGPISYIKPYDYDKPLSTENPISLDIYTGGLQFTPTKVESTIFRVKISEYRDGKLIGYFYRDYYIAVLETPEMHAPQIISNNFYTSVDAGEEANLVITTYDPDMEDTLTMAWNQGIKTAIWSDNNGLVKHPTATVKWTPTMEDINPIPHVFTVMVKDDNCPINLRSTRIFQILVKDPNAGLEENAETDYKIYPNPTSDNLNIISQKNIEQIELFDLTGKVLFQKQSINSKSIQLDVSMFQKGIYLLRIDGVTFRKIVVE
jgi:hypothetical protein